MSYVVRHDRLMSCAVVLFLNILSLFSSLNQVATPYKTT
jgi:hypothetical protein